MKIKVPYRQLTGVMFFLLFSQLLQAQLHTIRGVVKDAKSGETLIGVAVTIKGTNIGAVTDFEGVFAIKTNYMPPMVLQARYLGYSPAEVSVNTTSERIVIQLTEQTKTLKEIQITDTRVTEKQKQSPLSVETMDAIAIRQTSASNFYEGLAHLKGVDLTSASIGFKIINTRGFNSTSPVRSLQLIDGVDNQSPGLNFSLGNFLGSSELDVQKVDLIVGASGAYYGPNAFNGVINMQTKSPMLFPGLSAQVKVGERSLVETAVRWAQMFKDKEGKPFFAYKLNLFYMRANDWEATNYDPSSQSPVGKNNPGGYDAVNIYGDEYVSPRFYQPPNLSYLGYGYTLRTGYKEKDIVDYNTKNLKANTALHLKVTQRDELIYSFNLGTGTTVYQGDNRFSLKDIFFYQNRVELRREGKYFVRAYMTKEDAGKSYDSYNTALILQNAAKSDVDWGNDYDNYWSQNIGDYNTGRISTIRPPIGVVPNNRYTAYADSFVRARFPDSLILFHQLSAAYANAISKTGMNILRYEPGTARFDSALNAIISHTNREGGSRFFDQSALYHVAAEYQWAIEGIDAKVGGNYRLFAPYSKGTIFLDTADGQRIYNKEFGLYLGLEYKMWKNRLKLSATNRLDKNQNFNYLWSPAITAVLSVEEHVFRTSFSSAYRNPTLSDQYINLNVGRATLIGNLSGFDSLVSYSSFIDALNFGRLRLQYFNVDPVRPEYVRTIEFGYRTTLGKKLYFDISFYRSWYQYFIGYKIGAKVDWPVGTPFANKYTFYRVATNSKDEVVTMGYTAGINYFFKKQLGFDFNYSFNELDRKGSTDPLIPAFNTPRHKYNFGISGRDFIINFFGKRFDHWSYSINYKYVDGFLFEGSPQFTGFVPAYDMVDVQVSKSIPKTYCTLKLGANNVLNNKVIQVYGGPQVGRLVYFSILFDWSARR